jgi:hypothetical protein
MQTYNQTLGNLVQLKALTALDLQTNAYRNNFISIDSVEPSLGYPSGVSNTNPNNTYYFPVLGTETTYLSSRRITGTNTLFLRAGTLGVGTNIIVGGSNTASNTSSILGGRCHTVSSNYSSIGGGCCNIANGNCAVVSGGNNNSAYGAASTVSGGYGNITCGIYSTVSGGCCNTASGNYAIVVGGANNSGSAYGFVGGGCSNTVSSLYSIIVGGQSNCICNSSDYSFIGSGINNTASTCYSVILGGSSNTVSSGYDAGFAVCVTQVYSTIAGGSGNSIYGCANFIGGGLGNSIAPPRLLSGESTSVGTVIAGGTYNCSCCANTAVVIGGGANNMICYASNGVIAGGCKNTLVGMGGVPSYYSGILGGTNNTVQHDNSFIVGSNITSSADCTTFVNNLSSQGRVYASCLFTNTVAMQKPYFCTTGSAGSIGTFTKRVSAFDASGNYIGYIPIYI